MNIEIERTVYLYETGSRLLSPVEGGQTNHYVYDELGRWTSTSTRNAQGSNLVSFAYTYDNSDQRTSVTREDGRVIHYEYDAIGQLTNASGGVYQYGYQYDETGNPVLQNKGGFIVSNAFNHLNQNVESEFSGALSVWGSKHGPLPATVSVNSIVAQPWGLAGWNVSGLPFIQGTNLLASIIADIAGRTVTNMSQTVVQDKIYTHDLNGNMTRNGDFEYIWGDENRLIGVKKAGNWIQQNRYDGLGRRIEKIEHSSEGIVTNRYAYDNWNVIAVLGEANVVLETYAHGIDLSGAVGGDAGGVGGILSASLGEFAAAYHYDGNGNVVLNTDVDGGIFIQLEYSPFGEVLMQSGNCIPRYQFSTKECDASTALNYYGYRFYVSSMGRWLNRDPLGELGFDVTFDLYPNNIIAEAEWANVAELLLDGLNILAFLGNDAISSIDPDGRMGWPAAVAAIVGAAWTRACHDAAINRARDAFPGKDKQQHCYASCFFNRCTANTVPHVTLLGGIIHELRNPGYGWRDALQDIRANIRGIVASYSFSSCKEACECP